ncbi:MAG TPA: M48 family metalloprotease [Tepidisphaeraceae bacterium]|nr:M48 family metalloprotease [Tepidisphaeraceae bacterium]
MTQMKPAVPRNRPVTGADLATAFDGQLEPRRWSLAYRVGIVLVAGVMVLLPLVYLAMIAAAVAGVVWYATHAGAMFQGVRGRAIILIAIAYVAPIIAGAVLVVFMTLPLLWRSSKNGPRPYWVDRREQPLLYAYVDRLCDAMNTPRPSRIDVIASANASAHIDNGLLGIFRRRLVLTIGMPLATAMDLRQFTGVLAHEFGHFAQGGFMRLSYVVHHINAWFTRLAYQRNGLDDAVDSFADGDSHWTIGLIALLCKLSMGLTRLILKGMALLSHGLSMHLSRQAEFDADHKAARIVGSDAMGAALELVPYVDLSNSIAIDHAHAQWQRRTLPDDLVQLTDLVRRDLPAKVKSGIEAQILSADTSWFDTHPPLFKRIAALRKAKLRGVMKLDAPTAVLFKEFDDLCKLATVDFYRSVLGQNLKAEHLFPTTAPHVRQTAAGVGA